MVTAEDVGWGKYSKYEGPLHYGLGQFSPTSFPSDGHKLLDIITQTEGGSPSAVNGYDRCIISVGMLQWCEAKYFLSSKLLGHIAETNHGLLHPLQDVLRASGASFKPKPGGKWRFFIGSEEVDEAEEQHRLFFAGANGRQGSWTDGYPEGTKARDTKEGLHAREWVAAFVNTLNQPAAIDAQVEYTAARMTNFATKEAKAILFADDKPLQGWPGAVQAGFLSFAANLPAVASKHLQRAVKASTAPKWSEDWCISILQELTFGPGISIYPHRYDKIRPKLEEHFGVDLPDFAKELKTWEDDLDDGHDAPTTSEPSFTKPEEIQQLLSDLGFDLGPHGVDGRMGTKTAEAVEMFQRVYGKDETPPLKIDGEVGKNTRRAMLRVWRGRAC